MPVDPLHAIQRATFVLGVGATAASGLVWGGRGMLATGAGAALGIANFWALRRLGTRAVARLGGGPGAEGDRGGAAPSTGKALALVAGLSIKMFLLFGLVWVAVRRLGLPVLPFTLGLSAFVAAILLTGLYLGPQSLKVRPGQGTPPAP